MLEVPWKGRAPLVIEWFVYWFMLPACIAIVSLAMMLGIDGTAILTPALILIFPLLSVPSISPGQAVTVGLFTEFFGFLSGVVGYRREGLVDYKVGLRLAAFAVPIIIVSSLLAQYSPALILNWHLGFLWWGSPSTLLPLRTPRSETRGLRILRRL